LGLVCSSLVSATAAAQLTDTDEEARLQFRAGESAYARGDYQAALEDFERAYRLSQRPALLFNIGLAAQRARHRERALEAFQQYLQLKPDADNRADVESRISELRELLAAQQQPRNDEDTAALPGGGQGPSRTGGGTGDRGERGPVDTGEDGGPGALPWILIAGGGAALVGGVALLVIAQADISTVEDPDAGATWRDVEGAYDRAPPFSTIGLVMMGVGAVAGGIGVVLVAASGGGASEETTVSLVPGGAVLRGTF